MKLTTARKIVWGAPALSVAILGIGILCAEGPTGPEGESFGTLAMMAAAPIFCVLLPVKLLWWRCPVCRRYLGQDDPIYCPKCGAALRQTPPGAPTAGVDD